MVAAAEQVVSDVGEQALDLVEPGEVCRGGRHHTKQGEHEVTATSYWRVEWDGIGQEGSIPLDFEATVNTVMGEAQVIAQ